MKMLVIALGLTALLPAALAAGEKDGRLYEMRIYYAAPGKLEALHGRFRDHTMKLFENHGMANIGYWVPLDNKENKLVYIIAHKDRDARDKAFKAFGADPAWQKVKKDTEKEGKLVAKVEEIFMTATDYSPPIKAASSGGERVFELRTYISSPGNLDHLNARFRDHTVKLFEKHGMTNIGYWTLAKGEKGADEKLIYILAHKSHEAGKASFAAFGKDPAWTAARMASEKKAGGSLTAKGGVRSEYLRATDYSPLK